MNSFKILLIILSYFLYSYSQDLELAVRDFKKYINNVKQNPRLYPEINKNNWIAKMLYSLTHMSEIDLNFYIDENIKNFDSDLSKYLRMVRVKLLKGNIGCGRIIENEQLRNYLSIVSTKSLVKDISEPDSFINKYFYDLDSKFLTKPSENVSRLRYITEKIAALFRNYDDAGPAE